LTNELYPAAASNSRFYGDTLLYRAAGPSIEGIRYPAAFFVWRPGWPKSRQLVDQGSTCFVDETSDVAACTAGYRRMPEGAWYLDLWAGHLGDGSKPLDKIAHLLGVTTAESAKPNAAALVQFAISPGGQYLLWSARAEDAPTAKETLWVLKLGEPVANARMLGTDVGRWRLSVDGRKVFWLAAIDRAVPGSPQPGYLEVIDFPTPTAPVRLSPDLVSSYYEVDNPGGPHQVLVQTTAGSLRHIPDADAGREPPRVIDEGVSAIRNVSPGGDAVAYSKDVSGGNGWGDLFLAVTATGAHCQTDRQEPWISPVFSSSGSYVLAQQWAEEPIPGRRVQLIDTLTCKSSLVAPTAKRWTRIAADRFVVEAEPMPLRKFDIVTLAILDPKKRPSLTTQVEAAAGTVNVSATSDMIELVYSVNAGWQTDGLYRRTVTLQGP
jgi:hypothetical protein